jgi:hypothetical protein
MCDSRQVFALLAGMAAGIVLGIFFSPKSGAETRDRLSAFLDNLRNASLSIAAEQIDLEISKPKGTKEELPYIFEHA